FANGAVATIEATTAAYPGFPRRLELTGRNGTVVIEDDRAAVVGVHEPLAEDPPGGVGNQNASASSATVSDVRAHRTVLEDFLDSIRTGREPMRSGREGRRSVA